ncbi:OBAP family protein [Luteimonas sp. YGD11-2]|uniref:OBAP family protein n=1 Tax=Luteimonas sp. YGD11-2 TaxID=2508168 RepID=UPI00100AE1C1|nr:OBAP family protein [Luteimonas sp. YGD11-2]
MRRICCPVILALGLAACGGGDTESAVDTPGADESPKTRVLEAGAAVLQDKPPIDAINAYLDGFHFYNGRMEAQMEAHHYCSHLNEDVIQCVIYDGNVGDAKLMGVEYIVSERLFAALPESEKPLWHSHSYEVKSGTLVAPGIPEIAEDELMEKLVGTYGKTWHTWHTDLDKELPYGVPQLMMGFTADGQSDPAMVAARDERLGVDGHAKRERRADIVVPPVLPGANAWEQGNVIQLDDPTGHEHGRSGATPPAGTDPAERNASSQTGGETTAPAE